MVHVLSHNPVHFTLSIRTHSATSLRTKFVRLTSGSLRLWLKRCIILYSGLTISIRHPRSLVPYELTNERSPRIRAVSHFPYGQRTQLPTYIFFVAPSVVRCVFLSVDPKPLRIPIRNQVSEICSIPRKENIVELQRLSWDLGLLASNPCCRSPMRHECDSMVIIPK